VTQLASDNFNRANENPLSNGGNWTDSSGAYQVVSNTAQPNFSGGDQWAYYSGVSWPNDQYSECAVTCTGGVSGAVQGFGPGVRLLASTSTKTGYWFTIDHSSPANATLSYINAGTFTTVDVRTLSFTDGDLFHLEVQGTTLRLFQNGSQVYSVTDGNLSSGSAGIVYSSSETAGSLDNWAGGDFNSGGATRQQTLTMLGCGV
jgi:hypothetical protein